MGSFTKSFKDSNGHVQWTNTYTYPDELKVTGSSFKLSQVRPAIKSYRAWAVSGTWSSQIYGSAHVYTTILNKAKTCSFGSGNSVAWANKATKNLSYSGDETIQTSQIFNANNPTTRQVRVTMKHNGTGYVSDEYYGLDWYATYSSVTHNLGLITLNVPPTFDNDPIEYDTNFDAPYAGLTTASVDVSNITAYYGGYITKATLKIGNQTAELTGSSTSVLSSGTLSILLNAVGTFTPTITVTDSRGQTKTVSLEAITVKGYSAPQVSINEVIRTDENGLGNDEGKCAVVTATFTWTSAITDLDEPTLIATELDDTLVQTETKWYTDRALQNEITDWSEVSNMPVYGFIGNTNTPPDPFDTQDSFNITITPNDKQGTGTPVTATLGAAFYTMDFLAGGHGIAFGMPSSQEGFFCNMDAHFADKTGFMRALFDFCYPVGSVYQTYLPNFDPNVSWGGTWELLPEGYVLLSGSESGSYVAGNAYGSNTHTLTIDEMPVHTHTQDSHNHTLGDHSHSVQRALGVTGSGTWAGEQGGALSGTAYKYAYTQVSGTAITTVTATGKNNGNTGGKVATNQNTGGGQPHSIMQQSYAVYIWYRTA